MKNTRRPSHYLTLKQQLNFTSSTSTRTTDQYGVQTNIEAEADLQAQEEMKAAVDARVEELEASIDGTNAEEEIVAESDPEATIERMKEYKRRSRELSRRPKKGGTRRRLWAQL
jgi:hypothetical protein